MGVFHLTKCSGLNFRVFHDEWKSISQLVGRVSHENTKQTKRKQTIESAFFFTFLLALELLDDSEVETNDAL